MNKAQRDYEHLKKTSRDIHILQGVSSLLDWDQETYMPPAGAEIRAEQLELIAGIIHKAKTGREFTNALSRLINIKTGHISSKHLSASQKAALQEWRNEYLTEKALPKAFVEEWTRLTSQSMHAWKSAREENAFQQFAPFLDRIVSMARKKADLLGYKKHPYDALINLYEPDIGTREIDPLFSSLRTSLTKLLKHIPKAQKANDRFLYGKFPHDKQIEFGHVLLKAMQFDPSKGRLDISTHPFSSSCHPNDNRITTRVHADSIMSNLSAVLHEAGHAFYEMGLPVSEYGTPLGSHRSLGMHESQSRWWETRIGLSKPFWKHFLPLLKKKFKGKFDKVSLEQFYQAINKVSPSYIRVEADEVTYSLHIILRYELEKTLIDGSLAVRDVPEAWNAKMQELLGIVPPTNREGCLQDIHWSMGSLGYFPTYTLGNLYAAHLFLGFERDHPDWESRVAKGELPFIREWLRQNIHQHGRRYSSKELLKRVSGKPFSAQAYIDYLNRKYKI